MNKELNLELLQAIKENNLNKVKQLVNNNVDIVTFVNEKEETPLHLSSLNEEWNEISFFLLEKGAKPDAQDKLGNTPFHSAAYHNNLELLEKLKEKGCNPNVINRFKWTPLHSAASNFNGSDWDIIEWLLENGLNPHALTITGTSVEDLLGKIEEAYREEYNNIVESHKEI